MSIITYQNVQQMVNIDAANAVPTVNSPSIGQVWYKNVPNAWPQLTFLAAGANTAPNSAQSLQVAGSTVQNYRLSTFEAEPRSTPQPWWPFYLTFTKPTLIRFNQPSTSGPLGPRPFGLWNRVGFLGSNPDVEVAFAPNGFRNGLGGAASGLRFEIVQDPETPTSYDAMQISLGLSGLSGQDQPAPVVWASMQNASSSIFSNDRLLGVGWSVLGDIGFNMMFLCGNGLANNWFWINNWNNGGEWPGLTLPPDFTMLTAFTDWPTPPNLPGSSLYPFPENPAIATYMDPGGGSADGGYPWAFYDGSGLRGVIRMTRGEMNLIDPSDYRLKTNVQDITDAVSLLDKIRPRVFDWVQDLGPRDTIGFIAHEFGEVIPRAVDGERDAVDESGQPRYQYIDHTRVIPLLTAALKELDQELVAIEGQLQGM